MAGHQTRVKKFCCIIPRQACHLVKLAVRHCARQVVILASHLLLVSRDPCLAVGAESDTSARTEGTGVKKYFETILARGILLKEYLSLVFFASDWPSTDRRPLCTRTGALSLLLIDPPQVLCQVVVVVLVIAEVQVLVVILVVLPQIMTTTVVNWFTHVVKNDRWKDWQIRKKELKQLYMTN